MRNAVTRAVTQTDVAHRRLLNQRIAGERFSHPAEVVRWMGAMQAQDYQQALWAIAVRTAGATVADVEAAIAERAIVQTWAMRGTLHFVAAENAKWMLELLTPRIVASTRTRQRQLELDGGVLARCGDLFQEALHGGRRVTRSGAMHLLENAGISPKGQRGYHILAHLAQTGVICLGPVQGKEQTFVLLDEWVPASRRLSRDDALAELAGTFVASHGPATMRDFAGWAGLTLADARAGMEAVQPGLRSEERDGKVYWSVASVPALESDGETDDTSGVFLLPGFDEYLLGYKDRSDVLAAEHANKVVPGGNGVFFPIIVADGQIVGTWKRAIKKGGVAITLRPFVPRTVSKASVADAAERFGAFLGVPLASVEISDS